MDETNGKTSTIQKILVVGAGVAGIRAALDLAETGFHVILTENSPAIGGILAKLDFQFPTDHCGMCRMLPFVGRENASQFCMRKSLFHDNIEIVANTEIIDCRGEPGAFEVTLRKKAQWVDTEICIGEGDCIEVCPVTIGDEFNEGLTKTKAIHRPIPHNLPNLFDIDQKTCTRCGECVTVCPVNAINLDAQDQEIKIDVGAVILAAGSGLFEAGSEPDFYEYGRNHSVITSLEFERILSASGTYSGKLLRPKDGKEAKKIAWLQCVGSRNRKAGRDFCSAICCMFALKEAVLARERGGPDTEATIFYMDMRTYGKDYYKYRIAAEQDKGVRLVRCRAHSVHQDESGDAVIRYFSEDGKAHEDHFDLVVLATGQTPPKETGHLRDIFSFDLNDAGFVKTEREFCTSAPGVFVCGSMTGLKDISESVIQGSAAAQEASRFLRSKGSRFPDTHVSKEAEADQSRELPAVSLVLCRWPLKEGAWGVDFDQIAASARSLYGVSEVHIIDEVCRGGKNQIREILADSTSNRVLFGACMPFVYKKSLKNIALEAGYNPSLVEVIDFRGHLRRLLHSANGGGIEKHVLDYLRSKIEELCAKEPVQSHTISVVPRALIIGGGLAGMKAATSLAQHGIEAVIVEREDHLGGHARKLFYTLEGIEPNQLASQMIDEIRANHNITVYTQSELVETQGSVGRFNSQIQVHGQNEPLCIDHGVTIVATGGVEAQTTEYAFGQSNSIVTQEKLELGLIDGSLKPDQLNSVVMIQCVESREPEKREYCSRLCCSAALKNALRILDINPAAKILVLYRDMMAYGAKERFYSEARARGVIFCTYELDRKPSVSVDDEELSVRFKDTVLDRELQIHPDLVVLSTGIVPIENSGLARSLGIELTSHGFFDEIDYKWKPVETLREGVYVCGVAHSPRSIPEAFMMAEAAAERSLAVLSHKELSTARLISTVRHTLCTNCERCVELCPYHARSFEPSKSVVEVDEFACQGCGICVAGCPSGASSLSGGIERQVLTALDVQLSLESQLSEVL